MTKRENMRNMSDKAMDLLSRVKWTSAVKPDHIGYVGQFPTDRDGCGARKRFVERLEAEGWELEVTSTSIETYFEPLKVWTSGFVTFVEIVGRK